MSQLTIAFTWWGTGWHILPILSLMQTLDQHRQYRQVVDKVYWFWEKKGMEYIFFNSHKDWFAHISPTFVAILAGKYRRETIRQSRLRNFRDVFLFPLGIIQSIRHILTKHIDIVFCKGWYVSLPVVIAAWICHKKIYVHDSDTSPGLTTKFAARFATQNFSWFPDSLPHSIVVWQILSDALVATPSSLPFVLPQDKRVVLVAGWSLWAKKLYEGVLKAIADNESFAQDYIFVFINGQHIIDTTLIPHNAKHIIVTWLITDQALMGRLYARADLWVVRGGTTTLAECKLFELPLVIVPLPITHDQYNNAKYYVDNYGDTLISQNDPLFIDVLYHSLSWVHKKTKQPSVQTISSKISYAKTTILDNMLWDTATTKHKSS